MRASSDRPDAASFGRRNTEMEADAPIPIEQIRQRAYDIWDRNHRPEGHEMQFWLLAEKELKGERAALARSKAAASGLRDVAEPS